MTFAQLTEAVVSRGCGSERSLLLLLLEGRGQAVSEMVIWSVLDLLLYLAGLLVRLVEPVLFLLVSCYDDYVYSPLQAWLSPLVQRVPREVKLGDRMVTVFTANIVSWARTGLVIPIACALKYQLHWTGCLLIVLHDFLDHVDGIVAKVHRRVHGNVDDPLLGGFMDAFCDKIVNVLTLWSVLMVTDFSHMTWPHLFLYVTPCAVIIGYEFTLGVVRVQDYFYSYYMREFKQNDDGASSESTAAVMEGKLKEKLESMGLAFLCLAQGTPVIMRSVSGVAGIACLILSVRLAHASLARKLSARKQRKPIRQSSGSTVGSCLHHLRTRRTTGVQVDLPPVDKEFIGFKKQSSPDKYIKDDLAPFTRSMSVPTGVEGLVDKVYTVGCFDLFHKGHIRLLQRMRSIGKQVIVGVHDSRSIYMLKKRVPVDSTEKRMLNVKQYADVVFCIAGTDPSTFLACAFAGRQETSLYVRGDDMPDFPARELCEQLMPVTFLPYTPGVSSTKLRKEIYNSSQSDPRLDLDANLFY
ncbi:uncharacterized protein LOC112553248 isoform X2 [Pomacea canaliculata]|nr:uncharacterized protein LOC112553248 isoform X2 [Pomacea canaliculata]XP_025076133.1 uncharacterized protein LOC112553248 isoform X2 [Pomacea canaliculata]XP_025076134.1 uncharacterized protein LOC112553248 isoform X2 [Pomacea canaliculata]